MREFMNSFKFNQYPYALLKQVIWLEKQCYELSWNLGVKPYSNLKKVFEGTGTDESNNFVDYNRLL